MQPEVPVVVGDAAVAQKPATTGFFPCEYCNKIFGSLLGLSRHFKGEHPDISEREGRSEGTADETWGWEGDGLLSSLTKEPEIELIDLESDTETEDSNLHPSSSTTATDQLENMDDEEGDDEFEGDEEN